MGCEVQILFRSYVGQVAAMTSSSSCLGKVFVTRNIPKPALDMLEARCTVSQWKCDDPVSREALIEGVKGVDALFCLLTDKIDKEVLDAGSSLKVLGTMSVGYDHLDVQECRKRGLKLGYTPEVLTEATAELTVALLLCTSRRLVEANKNVQSGGWGTWGPMWMLGRGIQGSTVGIVGLGRIGTSVAKKLKPFNPEKIIYYNPVSRPNVAGELGLEYANWDKLLESSDFIIICCQLNDATRHMFNRDAFRKMKPSAILVNTSRGPVVEQEALYEALSEGQIRATGLDVCYPEPIPTDHKLLGLENCVILPHIGSATEEARTRMATLTAENILNGLQGKPLPAEIPG